MPRQPSTVPSPSEWDFRLLTDNEARRVVRYEYAREIPAFHDEVKAWHRTPFRHCTGRNYPAWARQYPGTSSEFPDANIIEVLTLHEQFSYVPPGPFIAILGNVPPNIYSVLGALACWFPEFPKPYLDVCTPAARLERIRDVQINGDKLREEMPWAGKPLHVETHINDGPRFRDEGATAEMRKADADRGVYYLRVDFGYGVQRVKEKIEERGKKVPRSILGKRAKQGMAASPKVHYPKLKWLATHRLAKLGFTHDQVNELCNQRMRQVPGADIHGVLPIWNSDVARLNAIHDYKMHLADLFDRNKRVSPLVDLHAFTETPLDLW